MIFVGVKDPENVLILFIKCDRSAQIVWLKQNNVPAASLARVSFNSFSADSGYSPIHAAKRAQLQQRSICLGFSHIHHIGIEIASYVLQYKLQLKPYVLYYDINKYTILYNISLFHESYLYILYYTTYIH